VLFVVAGIAVAQRAARAVAPLRPRRHHDDHDRPRCPNSIGMVNGAIVGILNGGQQAAMRPLPVSPS
jgi:hypothetical protein